MNRAARDAPPADRFDEAIGPDGSVRGPWRNVRSLIDAVDVERQRAADRMLEAESAGHLVHDIAHEIGPGSAASLGRPWRLDPLPYVVAAAEFDALAAGIEQRMRLLDTILCDVYGSRALMRAGIVDPARVFASPAWRPGARSRGGVRSSAGPGFLVAYAVDVVRIADGSWRVVRDLTDAPSGLGETMIGRTVMARLLPDVMRRAGVAPITEFAADVRAALAARAGTARRSPRVVLLSGSLADPTYVEHSYLAAHLGYHLAFGADLLVRDGRVWLRSLGGLEPIDVVFRRIDDGALDPLEAEASGCGGVAGLVSASVRPAANVSLANGFGSGLAEDEAIAAMVHGVARAVGEGPPMLAPLAPGERLATAPASDGAGLRAASTVLRLHAVWGPGGVSVMAGGAGRVLAAGDDPAHPTSGWAKDVWIVDGARPRVTVTRPLMPQVDLSASLPTRVADALFGLGRAAERAEVAARTARVVALQFHQDSALAGADDGGWTRATLAVLRAARAQPFIAAEGEVENAAPIGEQIRAEVAATARCAATQLGIVLAEALSVREHLSTTTARVLSRLAASRASIDGGRAGEEIDAALVDLAALAGLIGESTTRGAGWRFLDLGRRLERALALVGAVEAAVGAAVDPFVVQPLADGLLGAHESLVAYRRRHRSDVDLDAVVDILVHDDTNPRSLAFQLDRMREHAAVLAWSEAVDLIDRCSVAAMERPDVSVAVSGRRVAVDALVLAVRGPLLDLSRQVVERWFSDPFGLRVLGRRR